MNFARRKALLKLACSGMCLALCLLLPFLTANSRELGNILCLMHIPVFLCGLICGCWHGMIVGATAPLIRSFLFGMPPFPTVAVPMVFELAVYGLLTGLLYRFMPKKWMWIYPNLVFSMIAGRIVSILTKYWMYALGETEFSLATVMQLNFVTTLPGVALQLVLIPALIYALTKQGIIHRGRDY
ncbi:MAG: ECF transporter S component [Ruminococcaceae bacterium]|nr:ECF transporter S component [Oscillospiraceae bacterium]